MKAAAAGAHRDGVPLVQHLVIDDRLDVVARDERAIEQWVDADQAILDGVRAHVDAAMPTRAPRGPPTPPGDAGLHLATKVVGVEPIEQALQVVTASARCRAQESGRRNQRRIREGAT